MTCGPMWGMFELFSGLFQTVGRLRLRAFGHLHDDQPNHVPHYK